MMSLRFSDSLFGRKVEEKVVGEKKKGKGRGGRRSGEWRSRSRHRRAQAGWAERGGRGSSLSHLPATLFFVPFSPPRHPQSDAH